MVDTDKHVRILVNHRQFMNHTYISYPCCFSVYDLLQEFRSTCKHIINLFLVVANIFVSC